MSAKPSRIVEAAGGIVYRWRTDFSGWMKFSDTGAPPVGISSQASLENLEVCVIHRPKYDDWSWPKGKLELNESHRHAAVREIEEETGFSVALGPYLGDVEYPLSAEGRRGKSVKPRDGAMKHIKYWMVKTLAPTQSVQRASALGPVFRADRGEVDSEIWMSVERARRLLSHSQDREILDIFVDRIEEGAAHSTTLVIVRHGKAEPRKQWAGAEEDRPITPRGAASAYALNRELACYAPNRLVSSPWRRCVETLQSFSWQTRSPILTADELTEDAFAEDPERSWLRFSNEFDTTTRTVREIPQTPPQATIRMPIQTQQTTAICMHRPVIGGIFEHLRTICASKSLAKQLIASSPYMPTGNAVAIFIVASADGPRIIDIQRVAPLVY